MFELFFKIHVISSVFFAKAKCSQVEKNSNNNNNNAPQIELTQADYYYPTEAKLKQIRKIANPENERVAICIEGPSRRLQTETLQQMKKLVIDPLNADVFVVVSTPNMYRGISDAHVSTTPEAVEKEMIDILTAGLGTDVVAGTQIFQDPSFHFMVNWFYSTVPNPEWWMDVWSLFIKRTSCKYTNPDEMLAKCFPDDSTWMRENSTRVSNNKKIHPGLWNLHAKQYCRDLIVEHEGRNNFVYDRVIYVRNDLFFAVPHPPLNVMSKDLAWIPETHDWTGYNDRHAVLSRKHIDLYFGPLDLILNGQMERFMKFTNWRGHGKRLSMEHSIFLAFNTFGGLRNNGVQVGRFLPIAALFCGGDNYIRSSGASEKNKKCLENGFKYLEEFRAVIRAQVLWQSGFHWQRTIRGEQGSRTFGYSDSSNTNVCFDKSKQSAELARTG